MALHTALIAAPVVLGLLARLLRRPQGALADLVRAARDLITLRMLLRDTDPCQRVELLDAHRAWRTNRSSRPRRTSLPAARARS
ncbi:hypothetical protein ACFU7X_36165 [Streptomyces chartreusis]|uniref:hypothetical protein n=1 Tax=Streptomyces chartreusis TaxID=1969 RepID=UPI0036CE2249